LRVVRWSSSQLKRCEGFGVDAEHPLHRIEIARRLDKAVPSTFETKRNVSACAGADDTDVQHVARLPNRDPLQEKPSI
jgi:hypothetical protein